MKPAQLEPPLTRTVLTLLFRAGVKATFHSTIFDIPMRPLGEDQRHRRRFTR